MASPNFEAGNVVQFTQADQETSVKFKINCVAWVSASGSEISSTDGFTLEDGAGNIIAGGEATTVSDQVIIPTGGVTVIGMKAEDLDAGYLYVYGQRE